MTAHQQSEWQVVQAPDKPLAPTEVKNHLSVIADVIQVVTFIGGTISALLAGILFLKDKIELPGLIFLVATGVFILLGGLLAFYRNRGLARMGRELLAGQWRNEVQLKQLEEASGRIEHALNACQGYEDKYERMKKKYSDVTFKDMQSTNEFTPSETNAVKIGLMKGVTSSVYGIYRVETYLPLPMYPTDDQKYFQENIHAWRRIRTNYPANFEAEEHNIHRIFIIAKEVLYDPDRVRFLKGIIGRQQDEKFDIQIALKEELAEAPPYEFAIYDNEIVLRLSIHQAQKRYGEGVVYFDDAVLRDIYKRRYKEIEAESCSPADFWDRVEKENLEADPQASASLKV